MVKSVDEVEKQCEETDGSFNVEANTARLVTKHASCHMKNFQGVPRY